MNKRKVSLLLLLLLLTTSVLGGCGERMSSSSLPNTGTSESRTSTTTTTTTAGMTTVTLGDNDPDKNYGTPDIQVTWDTQKAEDVLALMNAARAKEGLAPLTMDTGAMMDAAKTRALDITVTFDHYRPNGDGFFTVYQQFNIDYAAAGENLAAGQPTAAVAFQSWWNSETHKANMMNKHFTHVSIAAMTYNGEPFWVQLFRK